MTRNIDNTAVIIMRNARDVGWFTIAEAIRWAGAFRPTEVGDALRMLVENNGLVEVGDPVTAIRSYCFIDHYRNCRIDDEGGAS